MGKIQLNKKIYYGILIFLVLGLIYSVYTKNVSVASLLVPNLNSMTGLGSLILLIVVAYIVVYIMFLRTFIDIPLLGDLIKLMNLLIVPTIDLSLILMFVFSFVEDITGGNSDIATITTILLIFAIFVSRYVVFKEENVKSTGKVQDLFWGTTMKIYNKSFWIGLSIALLVLSIPFGFKIYLIFTDMKLFFYFGSLITIFAFTFGYAEAIYDKHKNLAVMIYSILPILLITFSYSILKAMGM